MMAGSRGDDCTSAIERTAHLDSGGTSMSLSSRTSGTERPPDPRCQRQQYRTIAKQEIRASQVASRPRSRPKVEIGDRPMESRPRSLGAHPDSIVAIGRLPEGGFCPTSSPSIKMPSSSSASSTYASRSRFSTLSRSCGRSVTNCRFPIKAPSVALRRYASCDRAAAAAAGGRYTRGTARASRSLRSCRKRSSIGRVSIGALPFRSAVSPS